MLGGSPMRVAVPPTLLAKVCGHHKGQGVYLQGHGDLDGHRDHQQHGGDVVQEG